MAFVKIHDFLLGSVSCALDILFFIFIDRLTETLSLRFIPDSAVAEDKPELNGNQQDNGGVQGTNNTTHTYIHTRHKLTDAILYTSTFKGYVLKTQKHMVGTCVCQGPLLD